jgi:hypothetical protein
MARSYNCGAEEKCGNDAKVFYYRSKIMFKEITDSLLTIMALAAFIVLAIYLLNQDPSLVGPI